MPFSMFTVAMSWPPGLRARASWAVALASCCIASGRLNNGLRLIVATTLRLTRSILVRLLLNSQVNSA